MSELLKCPFCGRRAELRHDKDGFSYIVCANDGCYVRTDGHLNEESAIKHWNTRTPMDNIVEKLEEREKYLEKAMKENHEKGYSSSEAKAMNERVAIRYAINIVKQEMGVIKNEPTNN